MILILLSFCRSNLSDFAECRYTETEKKKIKRSCLHAFLEVSRRIFLNKGKIDFCQFNLRDTSRKNV